ncbi:MAG: glutathione S-transferase [Gammaproteobacteria bacterium]|nr:glutathione S-transferase [Gammaproteobacteria bacterium]MCW8988670.1 glutathione S-transferase [Gammaproteobacteria bacterium]
MSYPILYSLRQCPYAMRARISLLLAKQTVLLRDIVMKNIPSEMLAVSPKGTVPVLLFDDSSVIEESIDIMTWALKQNDPSNLLRSHQPNDYQEMFELIKRNDNEFIEALNKYKAAARYHDAAESTYRRQCEPFITYLEECLTRHDYLIGATPSLADYAILPFIRQFSRVDRKWYLQAPYPKLQHWLEQHYQNPIFSKAMTKYPQWLDNKESILFGSE